MFQEEGKSRSKLEEENNLPISSLHFSNQEKGKMQHEKLSKGKWKPMNWYKARHGHHKNTQSKTTVCSSFSFSTILCYYHTIAPWVSLIVR